MSLDAEHSPSPGSRTAGRLGVIGSIVRAGIGAILRQVENATPGRYHPTVREGACDRAVTLRVVRHNMLRRAEQHRRPRAAAGEVSGDR